MTIDTNRYTLIPESLFHEKGLDPFEFRIIIFILLDQPRADDQFTINYVAKELHMGWKTAQLRFKYLVEKGYLRIRPGGKCGKAVYMADQKLLMLRKN